MTQGIALSAADAVGRAAGLAQSDCGAGVGVQQTHFFDLPDGTQLVVQPYRPGVTTVSIFGSILAKSHTGTVSTPHGIHIGSSVGELRSVYPDLVAPEAGPYPGETGCALSDGSGHWIDFVVDDKLGTVQQIDVNTDNVVPAEVWG